MERVEYTLDGQPFDLAVARPAGPGPHPAVLICHAFSGRQPFEEAKAQALAALGYVGVALDLYGVGRRGTDRASSGALMNGLLTDRAAFHGRLTEAVAQARALPGVDPDRLAAIGFCFGGLSALCMARLGLPLKGAVSFHGLLKLGAPLPTRPQARMLVLHGQDDPMVPPADVGAFAAEMQRVGGDWQLHAYPGV
ncbi:MAG: dienelactone hydrolase family protein, partial [Myxococcales bacterium]|nr:dienelactone hydrolase family protein [Myxococcales bacterium]